MTLRAPFPWFGGKSRAAHLVWPRLGPVPNYVEAFAGSLAIMLMRPHPPQIETVNDLDCYVANFWRALSNDPEQVALYADQPVFEADLHARHHWLVHQADFREKMKTDPDFYDAKIAGWWVWGRCTWIAGGWCDTSKIENLGRRIPNIAGGFGGGTGVVRMGRSIPNMIREGVHSQRMSEDGVLGYMLKLADRLRNVRVVSGDWSRVCTPAVTTGLGLTGLVLDPPYTDDLSNGIYTHGDPRVATAVSRWAVANGNNPELRIALCGYEGQYKNIPETWECVPWTAQGGYGGQREDGSNVNRFRERIWFSPHCLRPEEDSLFSEMYAEEESE